MSDQKCAACGCSNHLHGPNAGKHGYDTPCIRCTCTAYTPPAEVTCLECGFPTTSHHTHCKQPGPRGYQPVQIDPPAANAGPEWLDAPTHDGWWWRAWLGTPKSVRLVECRKDGAEFRFADDYLGGPLWRVPENSSYNRWQPLGAPPAPPPPALPKSRTPELRAYVVHNKLQPGCYFERFTLDGTEINLGGGTTTGPREACIKSAREKSGCEPTVEGAE